MKFDSKLLLEQLIRTHILEQSIVTDTNVKRGKVGSATSYGSIDSPSNVSSADRSFFDTVNSIKRTNPKSKRPYIKLYSNVTKGGTASENDRLQSVAGVARREASTLIDRFGGPGALSEYSAIISKPQDAKKQADASSTVSYDPSAKLYYTVVFIMTSDINSTISPDWGVTGTMKFFGEDQISSLKPVVTPKDDEVIDDTSKNKQDIDTKDDSEPTPEQLSNQFITKKTQLNNLGNSGDAAKNLQRAMYTFGMKETSGNLKNLPEFKSFINASWNTSRVPGDWDGEIGTRSKALIDILKAGFIVTSDADLYTKLQAAINEIQPNLSESKLYKLTEQAGFDIDKAKKASSNKQRVVKKDDSSSGTKKKKPTTTEKEDNLHKLLLQINDVLDFEYKSHMTIQDKIDSENRIVIFYPPERNVDIKHRALRFTEKEGKITVDWNVEWSTEARERQGIMTRWKAYPNRGGTIVPSDISDTWELTKVKTSNETMGAGKIITLKDALKYPWKYFYAPITDDSVSPEEWFKRSVPDFVKIANDMKKFVETYSNFRGYKDWDDDEAGALRDVLGPYLQNTIKPKADAFWNKWLKSLYDKNIYTDKMLIQDFDLQYAEDLGNLDGIQNRWHKKLMQNYLILTAQYTKKAIDDPVRFAAYWNPAADSSQYTLSDRMYYHRDWYFYYWNEKGARSLITADPDF